LRDNDGEFKWMAGSHNTRKKQPAEGERGSLYWLPLEDKKLRDMIECLHIGDHDVIVFGEIYGAGIQDLDYGVKRGYRVFDISIDGKYLPWHLLKAECECFGVETVPLLYFGPFSQEVVKEHTYGKTTLADPSDIQSKFKDREGCVITAADETYYAPTGGRMIVKSVSADYLDRKGAQDNE
jgi:RNA ligase (TIGR02306 family)